MALLKVSRTQKTVFVYTLLILSAIQSTCHSQPIVGSRNMYPTATNFNPVHAPRGYTSSQFADPLYSQPFHGQYWSGHGVGAAHYPQYPGQYTGNQQYGVYGGYPGGYGYPQYGSYNPYGQYGQYSPQHSLYPDAGYNAYHGQYPMFNANYWSGGHYYPQQYPAYQYPAYPSYPMYPHPGQYPMYHSPRYYQHYPHHPYPYDPYRHYDDGRIFGVRKHTLAKGVIGAVLAGVVAGKVAQRGK